MLRGSHWAQQSFHVVQCGPSLKVVLTSTQHERSVVHSVLFLAVYLWSQDKVTPRSCDTEKVAQNQRLVGFRLYFGSTTVEEINAAFRR